MQRFLPEWSFTLGFATPEANRPGVSPRLDASEFATGLHANFRLRAAGETVYRIWRVYMAGSVLAFETAGISIFQTLLAKPDRPWRCLWPAP